MQRPWGRGERGGGGRLCAHSGTSHICGRSPCISGDWFLVSIPCPRMLGPQAELSSPLNAPCLKQCLALSKFTLFLRFIHSLHTVRVHPSMSIHTCVDSCNSHPPRGQRAVPTPQHVLLSCLSAARPSPHSPHVPWPPLSLAL